MKTADRKNMRDAYIGESLTVFRRDQGAHAEQKCGGISAGFISERILK